MTCPDGTRPPIATAPPTGVDANPASMDGDDSDANTGVAFVIVIATSPLSAA